MLIYDNFPSLHHAFRFATITHIRRPHRDLSVCTTPRDELDPFPFTLAPPVVYIDRPSDPDESAELEHELAELAGYCGGRFAGT